jgi:hypothetical protein
MTGETKRMLRRRTAAHGVRRGFMRAGCAVCALALALPQSSGAQEAGGPAPLLAIDIFAGVRHEDNDPGGSETVGLAEIGLGYFTSTANQRLSFSADATAELNEGGLDLTDPALDLSYAVFSRQTELAFDLSYSSTDLDSAALDPDFDAGDLTPRAGAREDVDVALTLVTGRADPFGTTTVLSWGRTDFYDGAPDPDETTHGIATTLRFTIDPRIELRLTGEWDRTDRDDVGNTEERVTRFGLESDLAIDRVWTAGIGIGFAEFETRTGGTTTVTDGAEAFFVLTREMSDGVLRFSIDRELFEEGLRDTVELSRTMLLPRGRGELSGSIGFTVFDGDDIAPLASFSYVGEPTRRSSLRVDFDYSGTIDDVGERIQRTSLSGAFRQNLTEVSSWSLDAGLASVDSDVPATADVLRTDLGLSYIHALSSDWNFVARASHEVVYEDGSTTDRTNVFSLGFERSFRIRP